MLVGEPINPKPALSFYFYFFLHPHFQTRSGAAEPGYTHAALRARSFELPDSLVAMTGSSRKNLLGFDIQSQNEEGRKDDDAYYATDGSL